MGKKGGNKPDTMSADDMMRLAREESRLSQGLIRQQTAANRPDQFTPWGSTIWEDLGDDRWRQTVALNPTDQRALEAQSGIGAGRSELALDILGRATDEFGSPARWQAMEANPVGTGAGTRQRAEDALYGRAASRLDPQWAQRTEAMETKLWNQGLRPGDEAYDAAMGNMERARADAYNQAAFSAIAGGGREAARDFTMDMQRRQQAIAEELKRRGVTINEINALAQGQQISTPEFAGFKSAGAAQSPNLVGAAQIANRSAWDRYGAEEAEQQGWMSGLMGLAGAAGNFFF